MDWESDPELIQIRSEFIKSLSERAVALKNCCDTILKVGLTDDTVRELAFIAHRLAGIAETYGFSVVGNIAEGGADARTNILAAPHARKIHEPDRLYASTADADIGRNLACRRRFARIRA